MRIGTRGSSLARIQALGVARAVERAFGEDPEIVTIRTQGDVEREKPLRALRGQGFFTKEIEQALLDHRIDLAVHSFKDLPSRCAPGLAVAAVTRREDPQDFLVVHPDAWDLDQDPIFIRPGGTVGTSAVRRKHLILAARPDIVVKDLRGNVHTRVAKLRRREYDAIFLAAAAVWRLNLDVYPMRIVGLDPRRFVPSPGQGALAVEMREDDPRFEEVRRALEDPEARKATRIERAVADRFGGGCSLPLGVYAAPTRGGWRVSAFWGGGDGPRWAEVTGDEVDTVADTLHARLMEQTS